MPLETPTYISDLNTSNPAHTDGLSQADSHLRNLKSAIKTTFPNINGAVTVTQAQLNTLATGIVPAADGSSGAPSHTFASELTLGFYRSAAGVMSFAGGYLRGFGLKAPGEFEWWPKLPPHLATAGSFTGSAALIERIECDGSVYNMSDFPAVGGFLGSTYGGNGTTTFGVPNAKDTGRYLRSRTSTLAVGTSQANVFKTHTHTATTSTDGSHVHTATVLDNGHTHPVTATYQGVFAAQFGSAGARGTTGAGGGVTVDGTSGSFVGNALTNIAVTLDFQGDHTHTITVAATGDTTETRPETLVGILCVHT